MFYMMGLLRQFQMTCFGYETSEDGKNSSLRYIKRNNDFLMLLTFRLLFAYTYTCVYI